MAAAWALMAFRVAVGMGAIALGALIPSCSPSKLDTQPRQVAIQQTWQLQPGAIVARRRISGGLGDISVELEGGSIYAPFQGRVQPNQADCVLFSSPEVPAYLLRFCGLRHPTTGPVQQGQVIGSGRTLQFSTLRKQPDGKWAMVEPSYKLLERTLNRYDLP